MYQHAPLVDVHRPTSLLLGALLTLAVLPARADVLSCATVPSSGPPLTVEVLSPAQGATVTECSVEVTGRLQLQDLRGHDIYIVVDSSGSTAGASGVDVDLDGTLGTGDWRAPTDAGDSTLRAELEAIRRALGAWEGHDVRVSVEEYSAVIPIPPGEPNEQGRIRTVQGLTPDLAAVRRALDTIATDSSVGATDYGGALLELAAEYDRSGDPSRRPVAFYMSDGKPTFPRFPYDATEPPDIAWALDGARAVAARRLPTSTIEIGVFDDVGVLAEVARLTGATLLPGLGGGELLDALATRNLDGFVHALLINLASGAETYARLDPFGGFTASIDLVSGRNDILLTVLLRTPDGEWTLACPVTLTTDCVPSTTIGREPVSRPGTRASRGTDLELGDRGTRPGIPLVPGRNPVQIELSATPADGGEPGGGTRGGRIGSEPGGRRGGPREGLRILHPETWTRLARWDATPCISLEGNAGLSTECDDAIQQLAALLLSIEVGELSRDCLLDPAQVPGHRDVDDLIDEIEDALDAGTRSRCAQAALLASLVTSGSGLLPPLTGPPPSGSTSFDCTVRVEGADVNVTVSLDSPRAGSTRGNGGDCPIPVRVEGRSSATGTTDHDVYFILDSSGSTAGDSGRDLDADGTNETTLDAELAAVRAFVERLDPARARVALLEFSAVIPIPPGEPSEQGRIRTVQSLTNDYTRIYNGLNSIRSAGSVGATDYGGALLELAAERDRNGDPTRDAVAFFLSDGKPTFPRYPYDSTESPDLDYAMQGAQAAASRNIRVNTYEVGVFDDLSVLLSVADVTGGRFYAELSGGAIVDALPGSSLVGIEQVVVRNELTGETVVANVAPDGSFEADIDLVPGENALTITAISDAGAEIVDCTTVLVGDCSYPRCDVESPAAWRDIECP